MSFSICKYSNKFYFNVVDIDSCHILFGRTWQFDVDAKHSRKRNLYWLENDGIKYTFVPILGKNSKQNVESRP